ncbi:MAG: glycerol-3-phosphate dehydrogenase/oxidase [Pirellulales bacterium]|nr:glycerol-3-phosphate dehydrogenase/oxidase [Pirellulales bacterium]
MNGIYIQPDDLLNTLRDRELDVLVIGGGVVGAGVARDAAMRGLRTALIEQHDFAFGTSSRSSRLLHGGIRYLAQGRVGLVWEASREKTVIHRIAPHLAEPLPFLFPTRKKTPWSRWKLGIGVKIYDLLCGRRNLGKSRGMDVAGILEQLPGLSTQGLTGAVRYFDGLTNDARLVLDTLRSAADHGAVACNYVRFLNAVPKNGQWICNLQGTQTGTELEIQTRSIVNATGPWSDRIPLAKTSLRLTKGVHLVIQRSRLPVPDAVVMAEGDRILFAIPWGERVILGTTDTDYDGPLDEPTCDSQDIRYILDVTNSAFPDAHLVEADLLSTWSGLRPLVADRNGNPSDISRRHEIKMSHPGWWDVTGGKLTSYRLMAEETVNAVSRYLGAEKIVCQTAHVSLLSNEELNGYSSILPPPVSEAAVEHYCRSEWARHLDDVMVRRTSWRYYCPDHIEIAAKTAQWMKKLLQWDEAEMGNQLSRYRRLAGIVYPPPPYRLPAHDGNPYNKTAPASSHPA